MTMMIKLSKPQVDALEEAVKAPLRKKACGWTATGLRGFARSTVMKLDRLRLLSLVPVPGTSTSGQFILTDLGRAALVSGKADLAKARQRLALRVLEHQLDKLEQARPRA